MLCPTKFYNILIIWKQATLKVGIKNRHKFKNEFTYKNSYPDSSIIRSANEEIVSKEVQAPDALHMTFENM